MLIAVRFSEIIDQASDLLQRKGRVSYRALKREFELDDDTLEDLKEELVRVLEVAADKDGEMLVWSGDGAAALSTPTSSVQNKTPTPSSYTPQHLADRILAELQDKGEAGLSRAQMFKLFHNHATNAQLDAALEDIGRKHSMERVKVPTGGRPREIIRLVR